MSIPGKMKTLCFDAAVAFTFPSPKKKTWDVQLSFPGENVEASLRIYPQGDDNILDTTLVQIFPFKPLLCKWKDGFMLSILGHESDQYSGIVLDPLSEKLPPGKMKKRWDYLRLLSGNEKQMILALAQERGFKGLGESEIQSFSSLTLTSISSRARELEEEGMVRIIAFSPIFLLAQASLDYLCCKIMAYLDKTHDENPDRMGISPEEIKKKFRLHPMVLTLALKVLERDRKIEKWEARLVPAGFKAVITPEEEDLLQAMEELSLSGEMKSVSMAEMQGRFSLSKAKLDKLLSLLVERKKVVQGKDGFLLHSKWFDEIISRIRNSGKKELSVYDFKNMTGLTRKYAIPLLELLDQLGVTRRKGSSREILK